MLTRIRVTLWNIDTCNVEWVYIVAKYCESEQSNHCREPYFSLVSDISNLFRFFPEFLSHYSFIGKRCNKFNYGQGLFNHPSELLHSFDLLRSLDFNTTSKNVQYYNEYWYECTADPRKICSLVESDSNSSYKSAHRKDNVWVLFSNSFGNDLKVVTYLRGHLLNIAFLKESDFLLENSFKITPSQIERYILSQMLPKSVIYVPEKPTCYAN